MPVTDLAVAYKELVAKQPRHAKLWQYYDGNHPLEYSTDRLARVFKKLNIKFIQNWCAVVVDSVLERLNLLSMGIADSDEGTALLKNLWEKTELDLDEEDVHRAALVAGEAVVIVWKDADEKVQAYYNNPALVHIRYDPENPRTKLWAAKWWADTADYWRLNMYYPDRLEYYRATKKGVPESAESFQPMDHSPQTNPTRVIPVFHFRRERRRCISELTNVLPIQITINKLLADMMVSAEFAAYAQRWIISSTEQDLSQTLKNIPGVIWKIPPGDDDTQPASVGQLAATPLKNFLDAIAEQVAAISSISRTPHHYFFGKGAVPSGEALIALESPLNKKCRTYIKNFTSTWRRVAAFLMQLSGTVVPLETVQVGYDDPETVQPKTEASIRQINVNAEMPLVTVLRQQGWSQAELDQLAKDKADEEMRKANTLALAILEQRRRFDQGEQGYPTQPTQEE